jgi:NAD(P)H-flavin reductase
VLTLTIREVIEATPRARIVRLDLGGRAFHYAAGQAVMVADHGSAERARAYSIANAPAEAARDGWLELLVGLKPDGTPGPHLTARPGQAVDVDGPMGQFTFPDGPTERRFAFVAGGTGIAPLRAMLHAALARDAAGITVVYSARTPEEFAYEDELRALAAAGKIELLLTVTRAEDGRWSGLRRGRIGRDELAPLVHDPATLCFICGPPALVEEIPRLLEELGVAPERIRIEIW